MRGIPGYHYVKGEHNVVADASSRIHIKEDENKWPRNGFLLHEQACQKQSYQCTGTNLTSRHGHLLAGSEDVEFEQFPMNTVLLARKQAKDKKLQKKIRELQR
jgi:hypothetical protein